MKHSVILLYGGRSSEHEISCRSARFILDNLLAAGHGVTPIAIAKDGSWHPQILKALAETDGPLRIDVSEPGAPTPDQLIPVFTHSHLSPPPIVFPMLHGSDGEDGHLQGLLELSGLPFVGPDTLGSSVAMNKVMSKRLVSAAGVMTLPMRDLRFEDYRSRPTAALEQIETLGSYPLFVKPVQLGSAVGVNMVESRSALQAALEHVFAHDDHAMVEPFIKGREIEFAMLGGYEPRCAGPGEVVTHGKVYTYEEKYATTSSSEILIPAPMEPRLAEAGRKLAIKAFRALHLYGLARVDFFLVGDDYYFNEANTLPGFTSISQYPKLWLHEGLNGRDLIDALLETALARHQVRAGLSRSI